MSVMRAEYPVNDEVIDTILTNREIEVFRLVYDYMKRNGKAAFTAIRDDLGLSHKEADIAVKRLKKTRLITQGGYEKGAVYHFDAKVDRKNRTGNERSNGAFKSLDSISLQQPIKSEHHVLTATTLSPVAPAKTSSPTPAAKTRQLDPPVSTTETVAIQVLNCLMTFGDEGLLCSEVSNLLNVKNKTASATLSEMEHRDKWVYRVRPTDVVGNSNGTTGGARYKLRDDIDPIELINKMREVSRKRFPRIVTSPAVITAPSPARGNQIDEEMPRSTRQKTVVLSTPVTPPEKEVMPTPTPSAPVTVEPEPQPQASVQAAMQQMFLRGVYNRIMNAEKLNEFELQAVRIQFGITDA